MEETFQSGDTVRHRFDDGPDMKISEAVIVVGKTSGSVRGGLEDLAYECVWFAGESGCVGWFPAKFLEKVTPKGESS